jgi:hypothetical protein
LAPFEAKADGNAGKTQDLWIWGYNSIPIARSKLSGNKSLAKILAEDAPDLAAGKGFS